MQAAVRAPQSTLRLFAVYAATAFLAVAVIGVVLAITFRAEANRRGLAEARSEATLMARTAVEPLLTEPVSEGLDPGDRVALRRLTARIIARREVLRLRVRDLAGHVVFSDDGTGFGGPVDDEALDAAHGEVVATLTRLNADANDRGSAGTATVEVYLPLVGGDAAGQRIGVLELYLPYAPIRRDVSGGLHMLYLVLVIGLGVLYLALFAITASVSRGLRREASLNAFLAQHDTLTELPNRILFQRRAAVAVQAACRGRGSAALAIIDLDRFKDVNDTLGHHNGDRLLTELARRLSANMRPGDTVARLGGDEFGLVLTDVVDPVSVLQRLREVIDDEVELSALPLSVQASVGYAMCPDDGTDLDDLLQRADVAMYMAKEQHAGVMRYDKAYDHYDATTLGRVSQLRRAIDDGQLRLHYQPQATLADGTVRAVEALVRWQHPTEGLLYPGSFLPLAEQTDVIEKLTDWVLRTALTEIRDLDSGPDPIAVAVNVSARSVGRPGFADEVIGILDELEVPAERLIVEVTETALLIDPERAARVLARLADAGVKVSLDDFGQGQTSLGYLSALPLHEIKIDRSFVADMLENAAHAAIVRSIIDLGHNLDLRVVGEGVETDPTLVSLGESGCDIAQGFLLARPMPVEALRSWIPRVPVRVA
jgi:diguanylate cyclase (GGDEF)-like protein